MGDLASSKDTKSRPSTEAMSGLHLRAELGNNTDVIIYSFTY